jgi:hypothetical protein
MSGKAGTVVFVQGETGVTIRPRTTPANPQTPAQTAVRSQFARAVEAYRTLTPEQAAQWAAYAQGQFRINPRAGTARRRTGYAAFTGLTTKFLQVTPDGVFPRVPPAFGFVGDPMTLTAAGSGGTVTFTACAPNSPDVVTELLWQPLGFGHQTPIATFYRSQAFVAVVSGGLSVPLSAPSGWLAPAYRFVNRATGQETPLVPLPPVLVI